jgi:RNA polymerase sigma-70 factor (ECF subfamily)
VAVAQEIPANTQSRETLEQLFWTHHKRVLRAAYRITGNMADAEDVAQSVFMRLAGTDGIRIESAESYLYRAAINGALDLIRKRQGGREVELELATHVATSAASSSPERQLDNGELGRCLREAITKLSARSAEMFVLRYIEGLDNREIARMLGTSRAVVAVMLHQARAKLKKEFLQTRGIR